MQKTGTEITIAQADTAISHIAPYNARKEFTIHGRGGTDFQPIIDYYNSNVHKYTCLIYLTDGEAPAPTPARGRMLWVMSSQSNKNESLIGPQIKLN
jgi:predicted metal-dependent peptidase